MFKSNATESKQFPDKIHGSFLEFISIILHVGKVWLIGAAVAYDVYFKFLNKFPSIEEDWDMEVLPITSLKFSVGGSYPRSSLMESFVPLGGFFSMPSDTKSALSNTGQKFVRCNSCDEKCQQEVAALSNGGPCASSTEQCQSTLLPWMQNSEPSSQTDLVNLKGPCLLLLELGLSTKFKPKVPLQGMLLKACFGTQL